MESHEHVLHVVGCTSPPPLERGSKSSSCTGVNSVVQYQCDDGLVLLGRSEVICNEDGNWSPNPYELSCKSNTNAVCMMLDCIKLITFLLAVCIIPQAPTNGTLVAVSDLTEGSVAEYKCDEGLLPNGTMVATCTDTGNEGEWIPNPANEKCRKQGKRCKSFIFRFHICIDYFP